MSMKIVRLGSLLFAFALAASAFCFDFPVLAGNPGQNSNSSTTAVENTNAAAPSRRTGRRNRRRPATPAPDSAAMPDTQSQASPTAAAVPTEQTDLSGTYTGTFDCADAGVSGETTLTITGNQFTLTDGKAGRISAATTRGYTGVAMQFGESTPATGAQPAAAPTIVSMRAKKSGSRLTLMPVSESGHVCSFTPAGSSRSRARRARVQPATVAEPAMPATPAEPAATPPTPAEPAATPPTPAEPAAPADQAGPTPPSTPASGRRGRRRRPGNQNTNSNTNTNSNSSTDNSNAQPTPTPAVPRN